LVYRGLNKTDFFENGKVKESGTDFVNHVQEEFQKFYGSDGANTTPPEFLAEFLGYPNNSAPTEEEQQKETDPIDDYFFKTSEVSDQDGESGKTAYELPNVPRGIFLGNADEELGIDIVLNEGDYTVENDPNPFRLNLQYARAAEYVLDPAIANTDFQKKLIRETATGFIDVAAFYGLHAQGKGKIYVNTQPEPLENAEDIYNLIKNFKTANTIYLYIQSNRQRSYNFYGNYKASDTNDNNFKIGTDPNNMQEKTFGTDGWPVEEISNNASSVIVQFTTDNHRFAAMYVKQGLLNPSVSHEDYYLRSGNLLQQSDNNEDINYTQPITFDFIQTIDNKRIASFVQLIYEGTQLPILETNPENTEETKIWYMKDIDDTFGLINVEPHINAQTDYEQHYVADQNLLLINFENKTGGADIATVTTKRVEDTIMKDETETLKRVTYETLLNNIRQNTGSFFQSRSAYPENSKSGTLSFDKSKNNFYQPEKPYQLQTEIFSDFNGNTVTGLSLQMQDGTLPSKKILGITKTENDVFKTLIDEQQLNNPKFFFKNELEDEESYYVSSEGTEYRKYSLCIIGEDQQGTLKFCEPEEQVFVTTTDNCIYASEEYGRWVEVESEGNINNNVKVPI
jgi:hypothetical protein